MHYYTAFISRNHAFLMERRLKDLGIPCELTYMPRIIMTDICNLGLKFEERDFTRAADVIRKAGLPGCRSYMEIEYPTDSEYKEIDINKAGY